MKLSIIIVSYNTRDLLEACLLSLAQNYQTEFKKGQFEIIVVDNASSDGTVALLKQKFPGVDVIANKTNIGFAKANNLGVAKSSGETILFLNPDTLVPSLTLTVLLDYLEKNPLVAVVTCKVLLTNGELDDAVHRGFPTPWRALTHFTGLGKLFPRSSFFNGYHLGFGDMNRIHKIDACAGAFLMIRREIGAQLNWFDEDYFWYGDDLDLCFRVKQIGYQVMYVPTVFITHYKGAASGIKKHSRHLSRADEKTRKLATRARFAAMRIFYRKHYLHKYPRWLTQLVLWGINLKQIFSENTL